MFAWHLAVLLVALVGRILLYISLTALLGEISGAFIRLRVRELYIRVNAGPLRAAVG